MEPRMAEPAANELRYERKFVIFDLDLADALAVIRLHPAFFREIYHARYVNNIYFDTPSLDHYQDNVRGVPNRVKCRIRWYGGVLGPLARPVLELQRQPSAPGTT